MSETCQNRKSPHLFNDAVSDGGTVRPSALALPQYENQPDALECVSDDMQLRQAMRLGIRRRGVLT
jgi:hypothetical protein